MSSWTSLSCYPGNPLCHSHDYIPASLSSCLLSCFNPLLGGYAGKTQLTVWETSLTAAFGQVTLCPWYTVITLGSPLLLSRRFPCFFLSCARSPTSFILSLPFPSLIPPFGVRHPPVDCWRGGGGRSMEDKFFETLNSFKMPLSWVHTWTIVWIQWKF